MNLVRIFTFCLAAVLVHGGGLRPQTEAYDITDPDSRQIEDSVFVVVLFYESQVQERLYDQLIALYFDSLPERSATCQFLKMAQSAYDPAEDTGYLYLNQIYEKKKAYPGDLYMQTIGQTLQLLPTFDESSFPIPNLASEIQEITTPSVRTDVDCDGLEAYIQSSTLTLVYFGLL